MSSVTLLIKPASGLCQLRCRYCFYEDLTQRRDEAAPAAVMAESTAGALIRSAFQAAGPGGHVQFTFQGGEPTLAGLDFFRRFLALELTCVPRPARVDHSLQTNGLALDESWCAFLREHQFLVGLSLDGDRALHDAFRTDPQGKGTWARALRSLERLERAGVEVNLLCVVTGPSARRAQRVYQSLRALGDHPLQFIPCLDSLDAARGGAPWSLSPAAYGRFLCTLFDCWYRDWTQGRYVSIRLFDDYLRLLMGRAPGACAASGACGSYLVAESDGSLYPCDFYVLEEWRLGNIADLGVAEALVSPKTLAFRAQGERRPDGCAACAYFTLCRGGCRRDFLVSAGALENYYCPAFRAFFGYALPRLTQVARQAAGR